MEIRANDTQFVLLGCGYTAGRVARLLLQAGARVLATSRNPSELAELGQAGAQVYRLDLNEPDTLTGLSAYLADRITVLHSVPLVQRADGTSYEATAQLLHALGSRPTRIVYISTTGVYGKAFEVNATTPVAPQFPIHTLRVEAENLVQAGGWSSLVLRPAGIYGPGRGVHVSMQLGKYRLVGDGSNFVSRIHVEDLAAHCYAALLRPDVTGAYPVADDTPCPAREVAEFCAELLHLPMPPSMTEAEAHETLRANRKVDGSAIRQALNLTLKYPSYQEGIRAALDTSP